MISGLSAGLLAAQSDQRLVELAGMGHERAFEALVRRYRRPLLGYSARLGLSDALSEDVLQLAFLQAWLAIARGVDVREPRPWLYRIVHNGAVNAIRSSRQTDAPLIDPEWVGAAGAGESDLERAMQVREALADVAALPHMQREAILLSAVDGRSHEEVASALGVSEGAVRGLLYRARVTLRAAAAALTPQPLISWVCGCMERTAPTGERLAELSAPAGAAGVTGVLLKGVAATVTAAVLVAGAAVAPFQKHSHRAGGPAHVLGAARAMASDDNGSPNAGRDLPRTANARRSAAVLAVPGGARARIAPDASAGPYGGGRQPGTLVPAPRAAPRPTGNLPAGGATPSPGGAGGQASSPVATPASVGGGGAPVSGSNGPSGQQQASGGQPESGQGATGEVPKGPGSAPSEPPATGGGSEQPPAGGESGSGSSGGSHEESGGDGSGDVGDSGESKTGEGSGHDGEPVEGQAGSERSGSDDGSGDDGHAKGETSQEGGSTAKDS